MSIKEEKTEIAIFTNHEDAITNAIELMVSGSVGSLENIQKYAETYLNRPIKGIEDLSGYEFIKQGAKELKKMRTTIEAKRKEISAPAIEFQKRLKKEADRITDTIRPIETELNLALTDFEDKKKAEEQRIFSERCELLALNGFTLVGAFYVCGVLQIEVSKVGTMEQTSFNNYIDEGKKESERKKAEEIRIQKEREELQKEREELRIAREELQKERELLKEIEAQKEALEMTYQEIETASEPQRDPVTQKEAISDTLRQNPTHTIENEIKDVGIEGIIQKSPDYISGFNEMRNKILKRLSEPGKMTRNQLVEFIEKISI